MTRYWLGVVHRSHVERGMELGIVQTNHGQKAGVYRMQPGDGFVYYSPKTDFPNGAPLREFTAIGTIADGEPWQADDGEFRPWRRSADYDRSAQAASITPLLDALDLTRGTRNWGFVLRRGHLELTGRDFALIVDEMGVGRAAPGA